MALGKYFLAAAVALQIAAATPLTTDYAAGQINFTTARGNTFFMLGGHVSSVFYDVAATDGTNQLWWVYLDPDPPEYLRGASAADTGTFGRSYPASAGWSLQQSANELSDGSLIVHQYEAVHDDAAHSVGANFGIEYKPGAGDPADVHWIQILAEQTNGPDNERSLTHFSVDGGGRTPYYDDRAAANNRNFLDQPSHGGADRFTPRYADAREHHWTFDLLLVSGPQAPGAVTVYGGVRWGWANYCVWNCESTPTPPEGYCFASSVKCLSDVPEPGTLSMLAMVALAVVVRLSRLRRGGLRAVVARSGATDSGCVQPARQAHDERRP
jgi:hypothetical protein